MHRASSRLENKMKISTTMLSQRNTLTRTHTPKKIQVFVIYFNGESSNNNKTKAKSNEIRERARENIRKISLNYNKKSKIMKRNNLKCESTPRPRPPVTRTQLPKNKKFESTISQCRPPF